MSTRADQPDRSTSGVIAPAVLGMVVIGVVVFLLTGMPAAGAAFLVAAAALALLPRVQRRRAAAVADRALGGLTGTARIVSIAPASKRPGDARVRVGYEVTPMGRPAYLVSSKHPVPPALADRFRLGAVLPVRIDRANPKHIVLDPERSTT